MSIETRTFTIDRDNVSLGEAVFRALCQALENGVYRAGDRLREDEVAQRLNVSRTPVREAFGRLMAKGWVQPAGGRGLIVRSLDQNDILELYAMREILEGAAARLAAQYAAPAEIAALRDIHARFASGEGDAAELARLNRLLHGAIQRAARNRYLDSALADMHVAISLLGSTTFAAEGRPATAAAEHGELIEALAARDPDRAERVARAHIREALRTRLGMTLTA
ncbi:GntR family transcriptional regulator [Bradyrhizobium sp. 83002]|uniref:GntR family transcriptional regulator n=1 Tax=Bradyrhizobium aeschynomenes TaxID=2734909 RepID=UPI001555E887|nr:GntR family transcriptional regulator [Bradyrhizobium aeschynomenes]NPU14558.1 GntR family transcriptional regulator [Bradyrhizobium aeschynomenes]